MKTFITEKFLLRGASAARQVLKRRRKSNPVLTEMRRASRRLHLVWQIWQLQRRNVAAAKCVAYERAHLKAMEAEFRLLLEANAMRQMHLTLALMAIDAEGI